MYELAASFSLVHLAQIVNKKKFINVLRLSQRRAFTPSAIIQAFKICGIHPVDPNIVLEKNPMIRRSLKGKGVSNNTSSSTPSSTHPPSSSSLHSLEPLLEPVPPVSPPPTPAVIEECGTCGRASPCKECMVRSNPLVRQDLLQDPICQEILRPPPLPEKRRKRTTITAARHLTGEATFSIVTR